MFYKINILKLFHEYMQRIHLTGRKGRVLLNCRDHSWLHLFVANKAVTLQCHSRPTYTDREREREEGGSHQYLFGSYNLLNAFIAFRSYNCHDAMFYHT